MDHDERQRRAAVARLVSGWKQLADRFATTPDRVAEVFELECDQGHANSSFTLVDQIEDRARREAALR